MKKPIVVDSGPLIALYDHSDKAHSRSLQFFSRTKFQGLVTTAVIVEVSHLLSFHHEAMMDFLQWVRRGGLTVVEFTQDFHRVVELMDKYADVPMDLADATVIAACERLRTNHVLTMDSDFLIYRIHDRQVPQNFFPA